MTKPISRGSSDSRAVALTFDDGPVPGQTEEILKILEQAGVNVTFFPLGCHMDEYPELVHAIEAAGHELGNHTYTHPKLNNPDGTPCLSRKAIEDEILKAQDVFRRLVGPTPSIYRSPYFNFNPHVDAITSEQGLAVVGNSNFPGDWKDDARPEFLIAEALKAEAGDILLFHDRSTAMTEALPTILAGLRKKGLACGTVSQLLFSKQTMQKES